MQFGSLMRDYENSALPLERRLPSLARRFPCLRDARGIDPWSPEAFHAWARGEGRDTPCWHAAHLVLNLAGDGPWDTFDAIAAVNCFDEGDRRVFITWAQTWRV